VTTRRKSRASTTYAALAQVTFPSDGVPDPSSRMTVQCGLSFCPKSRAILIAPIRRSPEPWVNGSMSPAPNRESHRCQERVQPRQAAKTLHTTGVVSRVPRGSRNAKAFETDRNTDRIGSTHQQHGVAGQLAQQTNGGSWLRTTAEGMVWRTGVTRYCDLGRLSAWNSAVNAANAGAYQCCACELAASEASTAGAGHSTLRSHEKTGGFL